MRLAKSLLVLGILSFVGCGGGDDEACDPLANTGCDEGLSCEPVQGGGDPVCAVPLVIKGRVFDIGSDQGIAGARVVALDANSAPASSVTVSGADGTYTLPLPIARDANGAPVVTDVTLRVDAAGYQTFPFGIRQALPISTGGSVEMDGSLVIMSALTDVGLLADQGGGAASIHGTVAVPSDRVGVLVVAETSSGPGSATGFSAIADRDGDYKIFNLPAGDYTVNAYASGASFSTGNATLAAGDDAEVNLTLDETPLLGSVTGTIQFVNGGGANTTSVILVVESTFQPNAARGDAPPGIRVANITGPFTIDNVPAGRYVILAAFENDGLVRDPDTSIGGTGTQHVEVMAGMTTTAEGFKVTGALAVFMPGAQGPEELTGDPTFSWDDDSSEDHYELTVFDAFGNIIWGPITEPGHSGSDPAVPYGGPALESGMYYQFRAVSFHADGIAIAATEDLKGVFFLP